MQDDNLFLNAEEQPCFNRVPYSSRGFFFILFFLISSILHPKPHPRKVVSMTPSARTVILSSIPFLALMMSSWHQVSTNCTKFSHCVFLCCAVSAAEVCSEADELEMQTERYVQDLQQALAETSGDTAAYTFSLTPSPPDSTSALTLAYEKVQRDIAVSKHRLVSEYVSAKVAITAEADLWAQDSWDPQCLFKLLFPLAEESAGRRNKVPVLPLYQWNMLKKIVDIGSFLIAVHMTSVLRSMRKKRWAQIGPVSEEPWHLTSSNLKGLSRKWWIRCEISAISSNHKKWRHMTVWLTSRSELSTINVTTENKWWQSKNGHKCVCVFFYYL